ncbi:LysM peptidoglycan-binding domain-containing protein [Lentilactobacillus sp. SPB1-3]|uniref:LysM peptidoglycan-binding domain-containing protein n=1 Tax=Lentilactobacillus terminaliae TaxID=3003483 RepID=A0ACD5DFA6_9LACO|nr:LysM peptidoglycan-binding domain-containing protein [Lentilactobacillus sp. SPB1-3]MCZ0976602.1 LysM peptidoglycan-binding domain-containing protein [Lentilactobacillus sp. SPB1-3]
MKKLVTTLLATTAAALGLFFAGSANADASTNYTVKSGDSVWAISQKFDSTINAIENANNIQNDLILPGQTLIIPDGTSTTTAAAQPAATNNTAVAQQPAQTTNTQQTQTYSQPAASQSTTNYGSSKSAVLSQMASRTGVSASTWNYIINRESNWQPSVRNSSSGAYGLFQNMHISGGSVQDQVNAAVSLYKQQGLAAWSM